MKVKTHENNFYYIIRYLLYTTAAAAFKGKHLVYKMILVPVQSFTGRQETVKCTVSEETFRVASSAVGWLRSVKTPATVRSS